ncbi:hypothetical protein A3850_014850 [Lewinella sp. 4G2]|nr:hypothetical protein A3850_014850 [Lewinella sp. 4G2]
MLIDRLVRLDKIESNTQDSLDLIRDFSRSSRISDIFRTRKDLQPLEERLRGAQSVYIIGGSLFRLSSEYTSTFEKLLNENCKIRLLLLNPDSFIAEQTAKNIVYEIDDYSVYRTYILSSISNFSKLKKKHPNLIDIRVMDYLPSYSLFGVGKSNSEFSVMVELYSNNIPARDRLHFNVLSKNDKDLFIFFNDQFEKFWSESQEYNAPNTTPLS